MSDANVEAVRAVFEPLRGVNIAAIDWSAEAIGEALGAAYSPELQLTTLQSGLATGIDGSYSGLDGFSEYLRDWLEPFSEYYLDNLDYIEVGDCVLVPSRQWGTGAGSGVGVELEVTTVYELRNGKIVRVHQYDTLDEARADADAAA